MSCLPAVMGDPATAATGAVMRPATLRRYATEAGFGATEVLPVATSVVELLLVWAQARLSLVRAECLVERAFTRARFCVGPLWPEDVRTSA